MAASIKIDGASDSAVNGLYRRVSAHQYKQDYGTHELIYRPGSGKQKAAWILGNGKAALYYNVTGEKGDPPSYGWLNPHRKGDSFIVFTHDNGFSLVEDTIQGNSGLCMDTDGTFKWNLMFQHALAQEEGVRKYERLTMISHEFRFTAERYAKTIISERFVPDDLKTLKPNNSLGGRAGGDKYIAGGILFKVVNPNEGPYRGNYEAAAKAAGHDLKGAQNILSCRLANKIDIHVALQVVVTYNGFRVQAQALLPLQEGSLKMGTSDGGFHVRAEDGELLRKAAQVGHVLNLAPHLVPVYDPQSRKSSSGVVLYTGGDVEGHVGSDGKHYMLDLARTFPPESGLDTPHLSDNPRVRSSLQ